MEQDILFLRSKEIEHKNAIRFLQKVWLSGHQIAGEIGGIKSWLKEPIHAQAKKRLTNKKQAQIEDLGIKLLLVKQRSLNMLQSWPSCQLTIDLYGAGAGTANFYQSFAFSNYSQYKIESINLTNNLGSKCRPSSTAYYTCPSLIITIENECIRSARKFSSNYQTVYQLYRQECRSRFVYQDYNPYKYQALPPTKYK